jgi:hypothetical protein
MIRFAVTERVSEAGRDVAARRLTIQRHMAVAKELYTTRKRRDVVKEQPFMTLNRVVAVQKAHPAQVMRIIRGTVN